MKKPYGLLSFLCLILAGCATVSLAQFKTVYIGVNGLTCSQSTRRVELGIRKLNFVEDVTMNLANTEGTIKLKKDARADIEKIAQAVISVGFTLRYLDADLLNVGLEAEMMDKNCFILYEDAYAFTETPKEPLKRIVKLKFIGYKYMPKKEFSKVALNEDVNCKHRGGKIYYVQLKSVSP